MKSFLLGVLKIALALVLAGTVFVAAGWAVFAYRQHRTAIRQAVLAEPRQWPPLTVAALDNATFSLATIWRDSQMYYRFRVDGVPRWFFRDDPNGGGRQAKFTLIFLDEHGFKLFEHQVPLAEMTHVVDSAGNITGFAARSQIYLAPDLYRRIAAWEVSWSR